jgi:hypothetical protein
VWGPGAELFEPSRWLPLSQARGGGEEACGCGCGGAAGPGGGCSSCGDGSGGGGGGGVSTEAMLAAAAPRFMPFSLGPKACAAQQLAMVRERWLAGRPRLHAPLCASPLTLTRDPSTPRQRAQANIHTTPASLPPSKPPHPQAELKAFLIPLLASFKFELSPRMRGDAGAAAALVWAITQKARGGMWLRL